MNSRVGLGAGASAGLDIEDSLPEGEHVGAEVSAGCGPLSADASCTFTECGPDCGAGVGAGPIGADISEDGVDVTSISEGTDYLEGFKGKCGASAAVYGEKCRKLLDFE